MVSQTMFRRNVVSEKGLEHGLYRSPYTGSVCFGLTGDLTVFHVGISLNSFSRGSLLSWFQ